MRTEPPGPTDANRGMDDELRRTNAITERIIGCAIEVHRVIGAGLLEPVYENALCLEFDAVGLRYRRQVSIPVRYRGQVIGEYRVDLIVEDAVVVELKSVERMDPVFQAQVLTYLKVSGKKVGLLINFNSRLLTRGIQRLIL